MPGDPVAAMKVIIGMLLALTACQSAEDRYWSDVRTIIERTQPKKG